MKGKKRVFPEDILPWVLVAILSIAVIGFLVAPETKGVSGNQPEFWKGIVLSVLCSMVASVVYTILARIYYRNDSDAVTKKLENIEARLARQDSLYDSGIKSIHPKSYFYQRESYWIGIISGCVCRLDLVGHSLSNWFGQGYRNIFIKKVLQIVNSGGDVKIVLSGSEAGNLGEMLSHVKSAYQNRETRLNKVERTLFEFYRLLKDEIPEANRKNLRLYVTDLEKVTYFYIRTDTRCVISPYSYGPGSQENMFLFELRTDTTDVNYVKVLEDDFDDMISNLASVDFKIQDDEL